MYITPRLHGALRIFEPVPCDDDDRLARVDDAVFAGSPDAGNWGSVRGVRIDPLNSPEEGLCGQDLRVAHQHGGATTLFERFTHSSCFSARVSTRPNSSPISMTAVGDSDL